MLGCTPAGSLIAGPLTRYDTPHLPGRWWRLHRLSPAGARWASLEEVRRRPSAAGAMDDRRQESDDRAGPRWDDGPRDAPRPRGVAAGPRPGLEPRAGRPVRHPEP